MNAEQKTVREIAIENPATVRVFEKFGIDYCCGGRRTLADACSAASVPTERVLELLETARREPVSDDDKAWATAHLSALADHIVETHHGYVRRETPRLAGLLARVVSRHGAAHVELSDIAAQFAAVSQELSTHMLKEEQVLFPYIARMEAASLAGQAIPPAFFGTVSRPIANMLADHDDAGAVLEEMRRLSNGYQTPADVCPTFRALYQGLEEFERDLHQHVHLENNILFPRAIELENQAASRN